MSDTKRLLTDGFRSEQRALNESFLAYFRSEDQLSVQVPSALDYEFYSSRLASRFGQGLHTRGVMSFGTGDCGQLGYG
jgi:hypothetical protein